MNTKRITHVLTGIFILVIAPAGMSFETARMDLPPELSVTERIPITGYGGRNKGSYQLGSYSGAFTRIETRWAVLDPFIAASRASSSFSINGPGLDTEVTATCGMKKNTVTVGVVTFDPKKMTYQCTFERGGALLNTQFILGQPKPENMRGRFLAWAIRDGEANIDGVKLRLRSVHKYNGSKIDSPTPVGYLIYAADEPVAAIELTDVNPTLFLPTTDATLRNSTLLAAMALSVLRDPADSMLGD